jgi:hypothetical protein
MKMRKFAVFISLAIHPTISAAQKPLPPPVVAGLDSLRTGHCDAAFRTWTIAWTSPDDAAKRETLLGSCEILARFGSLHGYDVVQLVPIGPNLLRVYAVLRYDTQPVYMLLVAYRPDDAWKITSVNWNTLSEKVFPPSLLPAENPGP